MTKWTIPDRQMRRDAEEALMRSMQNMGQLMDRIEALEAALRAIITEAPSLNYAQGIARDALHGGDE